MKIRQIICLLLIGTFATSCNDSSQQASSKGTSGDINVHTDAEKDSILFHLNMLDSVVKLPPPKDSIYKCCYRSIQLLEEKTLIMADVDGDYTGSIGFKKSDLEKWRIWYKQKYRK